MHRCLIYLAKKPLIQQRQKTKKTRHQDNVFEISRLRSFKDKTQDVSWKLPGLPPSSRSKCDQKNKDKTKNYDAFYSVFLSLASEEKGD
jgi:hypothetical protein